MNQYLDVNPEVAQAVAQGKPVVALESTIISHGMPYPQNVETALKVEQIIRDNGAVPATIAILGGRLKAGLTAEEIESITYLKDAPALALYGMNGGNGVLLITTKRGRPGDGKLKISVTGRYGVQLPQYKPRFKGSYEYATLYNEALANDGLPAQYLSLIHISEPTRP